jgi:hypothetical protein
VTFDLRGTSCPSRPRHDVAGPSLNMDLSKDKVLGEAGLGDADVTAHSACNLNGGLVLKGAGPSRMLAIRGAITTWGWRSTGET